MEDIIRDFTLHYLQEGQAQCPRIYMTPGTGIVQWNDGRLIQGIEEVRAGPGIELRDQDLSSAWLAFKDLATANLSGSNLTNANLEGSSLAGADLANADLTHAKLNWSDLTGVNLSGASLRNADLRDTVGLASATFDSETLYSQRTVFPDDFDPNEAGLTFKPTRVGDFDADDELGIHDIDLLTARIRHDQEFLDRWHWRNIQPDFALAGSERIDQVDLNYWVQNLKKTWLGDTNLDGLFKSSDLVLVFQAGRYEDESGETSRWSHGDWNSDGVFNSSDLVVALRDGGYEQGPRHAAKAVPEPTITILMLAAGLIGFTVRQRTVGRLNSPGAPTLIPPAR